MNHQAADYSYYGKIKVSGADSLSVLHNILTQDIKKIPAGGHAPSALLTHTGKILLYMEVFRFDDHLILVTENTAASKGIPFIDKYVITEDVQLEDVTEAYSFFQVFSPVPDYFLCPKNQTSELITAKNLALVSAEEGEKLRIEAGIPRYGVDIDENTILSEAGLDKIAVSYTKGCYPGQEVIARIDTYKGLTKKLTGFILEGTTVKPGDKIYLEGKEESIGWVTSAAESKNAEKRPALGYLLKGFFDRLLTVKIISAGKLVKGKTVGLKF